MFDTLPASAIAFANCEDPKGAEILSDTPAVPKTFGFTTDADISGSKLELSETGTTFSVSSEFGEFSIQSPLLGRFNAENLLGVIAICLYRGIATDVIQEASQTIRGIRGRMETLRLVGDVTAIIDYAHSEDSLLRVLETMKPLTRGRLLVVFGAGGDRDKSKRPKMGAAVARFADKSWVTSDNPRTEEPLSIIDDVVKGMQSASFVVEPDREKAIRASLEDAQPGDVVMIVGKGQETYQEIQGIKHPFDDREKVLAVRSLANEWGAR